MIPTIILLLLRRYRRRHPEKAALIQSMIKKGSRFILLIIICTAISVIVSAQEKKLAYNIKRNGKVVGNINFSQYSSDTKTFLKMNSEVKTRFLFTFTAKAQEETIFDNGIMTFSSIYRKMNGNVKADKKIKATGNSYTIYKGSKTETLNNFPIRYNMLSIYIIEPVNIAKVYSDNFQQFVDILRMGSHHYKIKFPDGNYNEYFYSNGICSRIEIHHSLYSATIELNN